MADLSGCYRLSDARPLLFGDSHKFSWFRSGSICSFINVLVAPYLPISCVFFPALFPLVSWYGNLSSSVNSWVNLFEREGERERESANRCVSSLSD